MKASVLMNLYQGKRIIHWTNYFTEFDLYIEILLIEYMFDAKILFLKTDVREIIKRGDAQGGIKNKQIIIIIIMKFVRTVKWYKHKQEFFLENRTQKIHLDFDIRTDDQIPASKPDFEIIKK